MSKENKLIYIEANMDDFFLNVVSKNDIDLASIIKIAVAKIDQERNIVIYEITTL